jgi:hypothetical protein
MFDEDDTKSTFEILGQSPHVWLSSATQLKRAADLVREELKRYSPFIRVAGRVMKIYNCSIATCF